MRFYLTALGLMLGPLAFPNLLAGGPEPPSAKVSPDLLKARLDAARKTYDWLAKNYIESRPPLGELLYRWSCRWLEAERDISTRQEDVLAAYRAHLNRMRELERVARDRFRNRFVPVEESTAAQFYRAEAEIWLERAKNR
jgi:hypothetical protein